MTATIKVLEDFAGTPEAAIKPGTIIKDAEITFDGDAWYFHPDTGEDWLSFAGDFEIVED